MKTIRNMAILFVIIVAGCASTEVDRRAGALLGIRGTITENTIKNSLSAVLTNGTPVAYVKGYLRGRGFGEAPLTGVYEDAKSREVWVRIEFDPKTLGFSKKHYGIGFSFDDQWQLTNTVVREWWTSL